MRFSSDRLRREKETVRAMIHIYCREHGHPSQPDVVPCASCGGLEQYAHERLDNCVFGKGKPVCAQCPIHCYQPKRRAEITAVMRYAGPKMILQHPYLAMRHLLNEMKTPAEKVQRQRQRKQWTGKDAMNPDSVSAAPKPKG